ncbi:STAS domain-containing protein [Streptomyces sp. CA-278952]|uniref:STAS domain-containing protein n=1 Tax=unclassified Streptomyces TaxID=2593676 RepID=UPI0022418D1D|nr:MULTISPECIES: STAS domain-containing protein [unclassified Streptomyces]UZI32931.1 STAS domain-containing protein [Streptomyces sp. VB1]WDG32809.1 STAS domain-containing protein [Streptomyces sp. CA-278952]
MFLLSYHLDAAHLVVELGAVVDLDNEATIEREIVRLLPCCGPWALIVHLRTPLLTPRALGLLLRVRGRSEERGVPMVVVAGYDTAREALSAAGLHRVLRVAPTLQGAMSRSRGCRPESEASPDGKCGDRHSAASSGRPAQRPIGPYADTSRPRYPGER